MKNQKLNAIKNYLERFVIRHFDFQICLFELWLKWFDGIGFAILTFNNTDKNSSLFAVLYQPEVGGNASDRKNFKK